MTFTQIVHTEFKRSYANKCARVRNAAIATRTLPATLTAVPEGAVR